MSDLYQNVLSRCGAAKGRLARTFAIVVLGALAPVWPAAQAQQWAQPPRVHYRWSQEAAPGQIGGEQVRNAVVPPGYFQPVRVLAPEGLQVGIRSADGDEVTLAAPADFALMVGAVYRLHLTGIPRAVGAALYPSLEVIDRLHPPEGLEGRHPIPVHLTQEDLELALTGRMVTKVIYLEQQDLGVPRQGVEGELPTYNTTPQQDAVEAADVFGRPVAILRMGQWAPLDPQWSDDPLGPPPAVIFPIGGPREAAVGSAATPRHTVAATPTSPAPGRAMQQDPLGDLFPPIGEQVTGNPMGAALRPAARGAGRGHWEATDRLVRGDLQSGWRRATPPRAASAVPRSRTAKRAGSRMTRTTPIVLPGKPAAASDAAGLPHAGQGTRRTARQGAQRGWVAVIRPNE